MAAEDVESRAALATSIEDTKDDLQEALLPKLFSAPKKPAKNFVRDTLAAFEHSINRVLMSKADKQKNRYAELSNEQLEDLYDSSEFEELSGFEKLRKIHNVAPPAIPYDASQPISTLLRFSGTGFELCLHRPDFWLLFIFHVVISLTYFGLGNEASGGAPVAPGWPAVTADMVAIPGGLITFLIVFYLNQTFSRFMEQHNHITATGGLLGDFVTLLRVQLGDHKFPQARIVRHQLAKLINVLRILAYASLPTNRDTKVNEWAWWFLARNKLLTPEQVEELKPLQAIGNGNLVYKEVVLWANRGIWAQVSKGNFDPLSAMILAGKLSEIRGHLDALFTFVSGPVPFAYYHLLNFILFIYLFLLAYVFAFTSPYWSIPGFFLILVGLLGMRELSNSMSNPLGHDKMDIAIFEDARVVLGDAALLINRESAYADELEDMKPVNKSVEESSPSPGSAEIQDELLLKLEQNI